MTTVAELIAMLSEYDPAMVVSVTGYEGGVTDVFTLEVKPVALDAYAAYNYYGEHDDGRYEPHDGERLVIVRGYKEYDE